MISYYQHSACFILLYYVHLDLKFLNLFLFCEYLPDINSFFFNTKHTLIAFSAIRFHIDCSISIPTFEIYVI